MSADITDDLVPDPEAQLTAALRALGRKPSADELEQLAEAMQRFGFDFRTGALRLGLLPQDAVIEPIELVEPVATVTAETARLPERNRTSLVQIALLKISASRALVVKEGLPVRAGKDIPFAADPYSHHSERIRALRTELLLRCPSTRTANVIAVVSPGAREGRSQLAAELALAFAQLGTQTLLVDADLRSPRQHHLFGCDNGDGLSQAIERQDLPPVHRVEDLAHMALLTAGPVPANPLELLSDGRFAKWVTRWRDSYQFVVIDTPPMARCSDALALAAIAGRTIVLTRAKHTSYKDAKEMMRRLANTQAEILGAVVSHH